MKQEIKLPEDLGQIEFLRNHPAILEKLVEYSRDKSLEAFVRSGVLQDDFNWNTTKEGLAFWIKIIEYENTAPFYELYPKPIEEKEEIIINCKNCGSFIFDAEGKHCVCCGETRQLKFPNEIEVVGEVVGGQLTAMQELIDWTIKNAFDITGQCGTKYMAIDHEEMRLKFDKWMESEKEQIIIAYLNGNREEFYDGSEYSGAQYYSQTFNNPNKQ